MKKKKVKKILAVLIVLFVVASCLFVAGTAAKGGPGAEDRQGGHGGKVVDEGLSDVRELSDMGDFLPKGEQAKEEGVIPQGIQPLQASPAEFGIIQLTANETDSIHPMFSPDGTKIAYMNNTGWRNREIWVMNADGTNKYNVTDADFQCAHLEGWSPDGTKLLYRSYNDSGQPTAPHNDLWLANADGSGVTQITFETDGTCFGSWRSINGVATDFSPDGSKIAFKKCNYGGESNSDLWVMDADGGNQVQLTNTPDNSEQYPKWSPDGSKILYRRCGDYSGADLWVINAEGTNAHPVVTDVGAKGFDWSPDGRWIVYETNYYYSDYESADVYRVRVDGTGNTRLTPSDYECEHAPSWFWAGCRDVILYSTSESDEASQSMMVMNPDGSGKTVVHPWGNKKNHDVSPDGEWIVFQTCYINYEYNDNWDTVIYKVRNPLYCEKVPTLMPVGIIALIGLLSVIAAISIIRKRKG